MNGRWLSPASGAAGTDRYQSALLPTVLPPASRATLGRPSYARIAGGELDQQHQFDILVEYDATLVARKLCRAQAERASCCCSAHAERVELAQGRTFDFTSRPFQDWLKEHESSAVSQRGRGRIRPPRLLAIKSGFQYERPAKMRPRLADLPGRQVGLRGMSIVFVAALRANRIPGCLSAAGPYPQCPRTRKTPDDEGWSSFAGGGWVPVDIAAAVHSRSPDSLRHFGNDPRRLRGDFTSIAIWSSAYFGRNGQMAGPFVLGHRWRVSTAKTRVDWKVESERLEIASRRR